MSSRWPDVVQMARRLGRTLITFDSDIGERIFYRGDAPPPGVIYIRFIQDDPEETARAVLEVAHSADFDVRALRDVPQWSNPGHPIPRMRLREDHARTNGLVAFSSPTVVAGPWPGWTTVASGSA